MKKLSLSTFKQRKGVTISEEALISVIGGDSYLVDIDLEHQNSI